MKPKLKTGLRMDLGEVRDQGLLPTCLAHATSTAHRIVRGVDEPLSAETLHYYASGADWSSGSTVNEIQQALQKEGQPEEHHCEPIGKGNPERWTPPEDVPIYRFDSKQAPPLPILVRDTISSSGSPVLGISLPEGFYDPDPPWIISAGHPRGGLHAVVGIGLAQYEEGTAVLIRNSWGKEWADSGHAWLDDSFLETHLKSVLVLTPGDET